MSADRLPHEKGFHVSWDQIHRDARALAWRLDGKGPGEGGTWKAVVGITRAGPSLAAAVKASPNSVHVEAAADPKKLARDIRAAGAPASGAPAFTTPSVTLAAGRSYTVIAADYGKTQGALSLWLAVNSGGMTVEGDDVSVEP